MTNFLKRIQTNALFSAVLYALLGLFLLLWPERSTSVLCTLTGWVLVLSGASDILQFLRHRDGTLDSAVHLVVGVILCSVGIWLISRPTLIAVIIPRIIGVLICVHGCNDLSGAFTLRKSTSSRWTAALVLGIVTLVLGLVLVLSPFETFTAVVRVIGLFLLYDGLSDLWITAQVDRTIKHSGKVSNAQRDAIDVEYRDTNDE